MENILICLSLTGFKYIKWRGYATRPKTRECLICGAAQEYNTTPQWIDIKKDLDSEATKTPTRT